ncbi:hypothetical protein GW17_00021040, partial [Ensete ventricosum]
PCKGQPGMATASPLVWAARHHARGDRLQPRPPCKGAAGCDKAPCKGTVGCCQGQPARGQTAGAAARGWPAAARHPLGAAAVRDHAAGAAANGLQTTATASPQGATYCRFDARRKAACG